MSVRRLARFALALAALLAAARPAVADEPRPSLAVDPPRLDFTEGGTLTATLTNRGDAPLDVAHVRVSDGSYGFQVNDVQKTLGPGEMLQISVTYTPDPAQPGARRQAFGGLQIVTNDPRFGVGPDGGHVAGVPLAANPSTLLSWMVFFPLIGVVLVLLVPVEKVQWARWIALAVAAGPVALAVRLYLSFDRAFSLQSGNDGLQFIQHSVWIRGFNIEYFLGVDGISVTLVILTAIVSMIAVGASFGIKKQVRAYFALLLLLETGMMGVFVSLDFVLFYVFWEVMLLPMYFLIGIWGGPRKEYAAIKFFLYTLLGSVLMLIALIAIYYASGPGTLVDGTPAAHTFNLMRLAYTDGARLADSTLSLLGMDFAKVCWVFLFIGFAIKVPMFPFHTWLPDAHVEAPTAISVILAGVLLKMGTYGMLRINFGLFPDATHWAATAIAVFGAINVVYGAFCAFAQTDLKRLVAYSSVSHMGYCLIGMAAFNEPGTSGAILQMFNHGTITSMLFILVGVLYDRAHTRDIDRFGGMATQMPRYAALFGFAFMASLGLPGLSGFIGEVLCLVGSFEAYRVIAVLAASAVIFTAAYHLWAMQRIHFGAWNPSWSDRSVFPDLSLREGLTLIPLAAVVLVLGFYPAPVLDLVRNSTADLVGHLTHHAGAVLRAAVP